MYYLFFNKENFIIIFMNHFEERKGQEREQINNDDVIFPQGLRGRHSDLSTNYQTLQTQINQMREENRITIEQLSLRNNELSLRNNALTLRNDELTLRNDELSKVIENMTSLSK